VVFSSHVDLSIASWARGYKDNDNHSGSKKEQYSLRYCKSGSRLAYHHGRSVFFLSMIGIMWFSLVPYNTGRYTYVLFM
jgi:hypothetical protein